MKKPCGRCREALPLLEFSRSSRSVSGAYCRDCSRDYGQAHRAGKVPISVRLAGWRRRVAE